MSSRTTWTRSHNRLRRIARTRIVPFFQNYQWFILFGCGVVIFAIGVVGLEKEFRAIGEVRSYLTLAYLSAQMFILESGAIVEPTTWEFQAARFAAPILTFSTLFVIMLAAFYDRFSSFCLRFTSDHTVICGVGLLGRILTEKFLDLGYPVVVIEKDAGREGVQRCRDLGAIVITGNATDRNQLARAGVQRAKYLVAVLGEDELNAEVASQALHLVQDREGRPLSCYIHMVDRNLREFLQSKELGNLEHESFSLNAINIYMTAGREVLARYPPFDTTAATPPDTHILVIGVGRMGETLIAHMVKMWFDTYHGTSRKKIRITMIDMDDTKEAYLRYRHPITPYCDLTACTMDIRSTEFLNRGFLRAAEGESGITAAYICIGDDKLGLATALTLRRGGAVGAPTLPHAVPIVLRTNNEHGIATLFMDEGENAGTGENPNIHTFPLIGDDCSMEFILDSTHESIARMIHEEYLKEERAKGITMGSGDAMHPWNELENDFKEANRHLADSYIDKITAINATLEVLTDWDEPPLVFTDQELETLAELEHERWMRDRKMQGWKFGGKDIRDNRKKLHPSMIPYDELPEPEKQKDRDVVRKMPQILHKVDLRIVRR